jgi:methionyl aminopeptidase
MTGQTTKTPQEIETMREAGKILARILSQIRKEIKPGITTWELEQSFMKLVKKHKVTPSCKGYDPYLTDPFPTGLCVSVNNQSVHCFPKKSQKLKEGDIITIDTSIGFDEYHADSAFAAGVGKISKERQNLIETTEKALYSAVEKVKAGAKMGEVSHTLQKTVEKAGFNVLRDYAGHGIGKSMHEYPEVPCYGNPNQGPVLEEGMTICIETLVCSKKPALKQKSFWETEMKDGGDFAQFEHTILVKKDGYEILTN